MALRLGFTRRLLSNSIFDSHLPASEAAAAAAASNKPSPRRLLFTWIFGSHPPASGAAADAATADDKPAAIPSDTLFVSGLSKRTTSERLEEEFSKFGHVVHARVVTDENNGYSKGFGFVKYATTDDAAEGIKAMDANCLDGWVIYAKYARPRPPPGQATPQDTYNSRSGY